MHERNLSPTTPGLSRWFLASLPCPRLSTAPADPSESPQGLSDCLPSFCPGYSRPSCFDSHLRFQPHLFPPPHQAYRGGSRPAFPAPPNSPLPQLTLLSESPQGLSDNLPSFCPGYSRPLCFDSNLCFQLHLPQQPALQGSPSTTIPLPHAMGHTLPSARTCHHCHFFSLTPAHL